MTSNVIKCNTCNIVVSEILAFVQTKMDVMDEESITRICNTAFSEEDIRKAKSLFFDSVPNSKRKIRKGEGKTLRDMDDIITLLKSVDPEELPVCCERSAQITTGYL